MMKPIAVFLIFAGCASAALAQLRTIPQDAVRGEIRHVQDMAVEIDGKPRRLAAGVQIRDQSNRLLLPVAIPAGALVKYVEESEAVISRIWILTPEEAAQSDKAR